MHIVQNFLAGLSYYRYVLTFCLAIVEGPMVMVASGILLRLGFFYFWPVYLTLMLGDFVADLCWYGVGYYGGRPFALRWGKYFSITPELLEKIEIFFKKHQTKILFISKITMGFGFALATLITAGMVRIPFKKYALFNFLGGFVWTGLLLVVGYFFGQIYTLLGKGFKIAFIVCLAVVVSFVLYGAGKYFKQQFLKRNL
jgi:membrane protein DedA with SNARE-associated domain